MPDRRPVISMVSYGRGSDPEKYFIPVAYVSAVRRAGGRVVIIPPGDQSAAAILDGVDGVIFAGGGDMDPSRWRHALERAGRSHRASLLESDSPRNSIIPAL